MARVNPEITDGVELPLAGAAVCASDAHVVAGNRLSVDVGPLGYVASELLDQRPRALVEIGVGP